MGFNSAFKGLKYYVLSVMAVIAVVVVVMVEVVVIRR